MPGTHRSAKGRTAETITGIRRGARREPRQRNADMQPTEYEARGRYHGATASRYDELRRNTEQWREEDDILSDVLSALAPGSRLLDVPVGTGRLLDPACQRGHRVLGVDISEDMLGGARHCEAVTGGRAGLTIGDIEALPLEADSVDYAFCIRFLNWVPLSVLEKALSELDRVSRKGVVVQVKLKRPMTAGDVASALRERLGSSWRRRRRGGLAGPSPGPPVPGARTTVHGEEEFAAALGRCGLTIDKRWHLNTRMSLRYRTVSRFEFLLLVPLDGLGADRASM